LLIKELEKKIVSLLHTAMKNLAQNVLIDEYVSMDLDKCSEPPTQNNLGPESEAGFLLSYNISSGIGGCLITRYLNTFAKLCLGTGVNLPTYSLYPQ
jgi:hypothetical protein